MNSAISTSATTGACPVAEEKSSHTLILQKLETQQALLEKTYASAEKTRKYILTALILNLAVVLLPLLGLLVLIPRLLDGFSYVGGI